MGRVWGGRGGKEHAVGVWLEDGGSKNGEGCHPSKHIPRRDLGCRH
jgi:hypothetical protein